MLQLWDNYEISQLYSRYVKCQVLMEYLNNKSIWHTGNTDLYYVSINTIFITLVTPVICTTCKHFMSKTYICFWLYWKHLWLQTWNTHTKTIKINNNNQFKNFQINSIPYLIPRPFLVHTQVLCMRQSRIQKQQI